jgi:Rieske 2Fe-2S family protein
VRGFVCYAHEASGTVSGLEASLPRAAYLDREFYEREREKIFYDQWVYVGRAELWAEAGSYRVLDLCGESIIVVRDRSGALHGHLNLCRHRGSRLLCGEGTIRGAIRCPYHGWTYALHGELIAAPFLALGEIPENARRLHSVEVDEWGGFLFVRVTSGETLAHQLARVPERLQRYPLAHMRIAHTIVYDVAANWKALLENYNECYHCAGVHPELCRIVPAFKRSGGANLDWEHGIPHRDGAFTFTFSCTSAREPFATLNGDERVRHNGELIYPNFMLSLSAEHVAAFSLLPDGPERTRIVCDFLFDPEEMSKPDFDPSDAVGFWDLVNRQDWAICESVQSGMHSRAFQFGYYAPMEDASLDIRRYIAARLGHDAIAVD